MPDVTGRTRLREAMSRPSRGQAIVAVLLAVVGFGAVTQVRSLNVEDNYATLREQDLVDILTGLSGTSQRARAEIARLEQSKRSLQSDTRRQSAALEAAQRRVDALNILAGLVPVSGPGIRVTVTETTGAVDIDSMLDTVEELRSAGAEAIAINGKVRLIAQSAFEDGVGGVLVDGELLTSPYIIDVIGDPLTLEGAMIFKEGPSAQLRDDGCTVEIDQLESIEITAVSEPQRMDYAQPD